MCWFNLNFLFHTAENIARTNKRHVLRLMLWGSVENSWNSFYVRTMGMYIKILHSKLLRVFHFKIKIFYLLDHEFKHISEKKIKCRNAV